MYLAACAIFRDEAPYLREWVTFHRLMGVEHLFLYDNGSGDAPEAALRPFLESGEVTLRPWPVPFHQGAARLAYSDCLERVRGRVRWLACIDLDEFLFAPSDGTLPPALARYEPYAGVVVRWQVYGSSGALCADPAPVISRFTRRAHAGWIRNRRMKSIVDPERTIRARNPHLFLHREGESLVDENEREVRVRPSWRLKRHLRGLYRGLGPLLAHVDPYSGTDIDRRDVCVERLRINHYPVKSREEFLRKARLKREKKRYDGVDYFRYHDRNEVEDPVLLRHLPALSRMLVG